MKYNYFVSYAFTKEGKSSLGIGCACFEWDVKINTSDLVLKLAKSIIENDDLETIAIINWKLLSKVKS